MQIYKNIFAGGSLLPGHTVQQNDYFSIIDWQADGHRRDQVDRVEARGHNPRRPRRVHSQVLRAKGRTDTEMYVNYMSRK